MDSPPFRPPSATWPLRVAFCALALAAGFQAFSAAAPAHGLRGRYYADPTWSGPVRLERTDAALSPELLVEPPLGAWQAYSIEWTGAITVPVTDTYTFATISDDGSELEVDGQPVVDNRGEHSARRRTGRIALTAGIHDLRVRYQQLGAHFVLHVLWARGDGTLRPLPPNALWPERPGALAAAPVPVLPLLAAAVVMGLFTLAFLALRGRLEAWAATGPGVAGGRAWRALQRPAVALFVTLAIGGALRLTLLATSPAILWPDSHVFYLTVRDILGGRYLAHDPYRTLLYPYYLSAFLGWSQSPLAGSLAILGQQVLGLVAGALFYWFGRRAFTPLVALAGTALFLCHSLELFYELSVMTEVLFTFVLALVLVLTQWHLDGPSLRRAVLLGIACGALVLVRPVAQWFMACIGVLLVWAERRPRAIGHALVVVVVSAVTLVPLVIANRREFGFTGVSLGRGMGLYTRVFDVDGLDPPDPSADREMRGLWGIAEEQRWSANRLRDELNFVRHRSSAAVEDTMFAFAVETIRQHPVAFAAGTLRQWGLQLAAPEASVRGCMAATGPYLCSGRAEGESLPPFPNAPGDDYRKARAWIVAAFTRGTVPMAAVIGCAAIGLAALLAWSRRPPAAVLAVLTIAYFTLVPAITQVPQDRYRLPVDALIFMLAAWGVRAVAARTAAATQ